MEAEILHNFEVAFWGGFCTSFLLQFFLLLLVWLWRRC